MNRRFFLGAMAKAPAVGAIAGRVLAEKAVADLSGMSAAGLNGLSGGYGVPQPCSPPNDPTPEQWKRIIANTLMRGEYESYLFENERRVGCIDPDIACMRSFSLAAKIAYQRQRNVRNTIDTAVNGWSYQRWQSKLKSWFGVFG